METFVQRYKMMGAEVTTPFRCRKSLRVNTIKISAENLKKRLEAKSIYVEKIAFTKEGFYYDAKFSLGSTPEYLLGLYNLQEAASQLPVEVLKPRGICWDMCAAPGQKTAQLAQSCDAVIATEKNQKRLEALNNNMERLGIKNVISYNEDANQMVKKFDYILLDAPCSGNFANDPQWFAEKDVREFRKMGIIQKQLLKTAIRNLNTGGFMVYSTCSLEPEENEEVIDWALNKFSISLEPVPSIGSPGLTQVFGKKISPEIKKCRRLWPHETKTQGFFMAKIRKND